MAPLEKGIGFLTPSGLHFERHHGGIATIDPSKHMLYVHGMVKQAKKFSMADVRRFPSISRILFVECSGNGLTEWAKPTLKTVQGTHGLLSTSEWTGVPLSKMLEGEMAKLLHLDVELHKRVIGQSEAVDAVADAIEIPELFKTTNPFADVVAEAVETPGTVPDP